MKHLLLALALIVGLRAECVESEPIDPIQQEVIMDFLARKTDILNQKNAIYTASEQCFKEHSDINDQANEIHNFLVNAGIVPFKVDEASLDLYETAIIYFNAFRKAVITPCGNYNDYAIKRAFARAGNYRELVYDIIGTIVSASKYERRR